MLVGREPELQQLNAAYSQMLEGRGSVLFLTGEAGLGKTTLVHSWKSGTFDTAQRDKGRGMRDEENSLSLIPHPSTLFLEAACSIPIGNVDVGRLEALQPWADVIAQLEAIDESPKEAKKLNLKKLLHDAAPSWAWALPLVGDLAHAALETSRLVKEQRGDPIGLSGTELNIAIIYRRKGMFDAVRHHLDLAEEFGREIGNTMIETLIRCEKALLLAEDVSALNPEERANSYRKAISEIEQSLEIFTKYHDTVNFADYSLLLESVRTRLSNTVPPA